MADPYLIAGPALISFSGGRTSAYMLHQIVLAYGGTLPDDVHVCFANTGKEREETLHFVHECAMRWNVRVRWIEWRDTEAGFEEVGYNSASRNGEPFAALIAKKKMPPNFHMRFCTERLKIKPMLAFMAKQGFESHAEVIGLRYDEGHRMLKMLERNDRDGRNCLAPLAKAKVTRQDVMAFWAVQPFDLGLVPGEGNCDLCFMKGRGLRKAIMRQRPDLSERLDGLTAAISTPTWRDGQMLAHWSKTKKFFRPMVAYPMSYNSRVEAVTIGEYQLNDFGQWHWWPTPEGKAFDTLDRAK